MSALSIFRYEGADVRTVTIDGETWFVASDVARILGYTDTTSAVKQHCKGVANHHPLATAGGVQTVRILSEPDMLRLVVGSKLPAAARFERWVFEDVLPTIRRTGAYVAPESREQLLARAVLVASAAIAEKDEHIAVLTPRAEAWDELADAGTDYAVADAAKILQRAGVPTSPQRLFEQLREIRWTFRGGDSRWRAYSAAVQDGYLAERAQPPRRDPTTGELVAVPPQVRVTVRGLERLRVRLGVLDVAVT